MNFNADALLRPPVSLDPMRGPKEAALRMLYVLGGAFAVLFIWSAFATLAVSSRGAGQVVPSSQVKLIQNLEGGILEALRVREGEQVKKDQVVAHINDTTLAAQYKEDQATYHGMRAMVDRLRAEIDEKPLVFSDELKGEQFADLRRQEESLYLSRKAEIASAQSALTQQVLQAQRKEAELRETIPHLDETIKSTQGQLDIVKPQVERGLISQVDLLKLQGELSSVRTRAASARADLDRARNQQTEARARLEENRQKFRGEALAQLNQLQAKLAGLNEQLNAHEERVGRRDVRTPVNGIVKKINITTVGGVIKPGETIMEIVPLEDDLVIEARFQPSDIGFLAPGQEAVIRITAYDYSVFGSFKGKVERIGADTVKDERGNPFYVVTVRADNPHEKDRRDTPILPGMVAEVDVITGDRSILAYIFKPFFKLQERALRER
jgi:adhesin transport system membrane fusion protein